MSCSGAEVLTWAQKVGVSTIFPGIQGYGKVKYDLVCCNVYDSFSFEHQHKEQWQQIYICHHVEYRSMSEHFSVP